MKGYVLNVLSLFDGMGCARIALERLGVPVERYYSSEIDKYAIKVCDANYPNVERVGDVHMVSGYDLPKIDLLIGGSPCQDLSFAGKGKGLGGDTRSALFFEYVRILGELREKNPDVKFLLENVRMKKESQNIMSGLMGVEPVMINSALVSAQNRVRLYWTNIPGVTQPEDRGILLRDVLDGEGFVDREKSYCLDANYFKGGNLKSYIGKGRRQLVFSEKKIATSEVTYRKLTPTECERLQTVPEGYTDHVSNTQRYKMLGNGFTVDVIAHILKSINQRKG